MSECVIDTLERKELTAKQWQAVHMLRHLQPDEWRSFGKGLGWVNFALRRIKRRYGNKVLRMVDASAWRGATFHNEEVWQLLRVKK